MKAIRVQRKGRRYDLVWSDALTPEPGPHEVSIDVHAAGINRADLLQASGRYPPPSGESDILGLEAAGIVRSVGGSVTRWQPGDRVCALIPGGGYAEQCTVHADLLLALPTEWSFVQAAAVPEAWLTAFSNLILEGQLQSDERVLIHAGASGVGTAAIQIAKAAGAWVATTAGTDAKCDACRKLGADLAANYRTENIGDALAGKTVDLVLDCVGAPYLKTHLETFNPGGRLIVIGVMGGRTAEIDLATVLMKGLRIQGTRLRAKTQKEKTYITREFRRRIWPLMAKGRIGPVIDTTFPMRQAGEAHRYLEEDRNIGKVILVTDADAE